MNYATTSDLPIPSERTDKRAPMAAAPIVYNEDQSVAWERMWDSFCVLASVGGPPHRASKLMPQVDADVNSPGYRVAVEEISRGIRLVSGLKAQPAAEPGWLAVACDTPNKARWLSDQINQENVQARYAGNMLYVPVGEHFTLKGEIKNVITAVAKTTHYWEEHLASQIKAALAWEERFKGVASQVKSWLGRR
jgi:sirohydrochlorin cobaltochelatase